MNIPVKIPANAEKTGGPELSSASDSGKSSPNTTYSIAPDARLKERESHKGLSVPKKYPAAAPKTVGAPARAVIAAAKDFFIPPATSGTAIAIPSGIL